MNTNADIDLDLENVDISTQASSTDGSGIYAWKPGGTGDINIAVQSSTFRTSGDDAYGIRGVHQATGDISLNIQGSTISTSGRYSHGIWGSHGHGAGDLGITVRGGSVATSGDGTSGIHGSHQGDGRIDIQVEDVSVTTEGFSAAHGIRGVHLGSAGDLSINVQRSTVSTLDLDSYGVFGSRSSDGDIDIRVKDTSVTTEGKYSRGINGSNWAFGVNKGTGDIGIDVQGSTISTSGDNAAYGINSSHNGTGDTSINVQGSTISTSGDNVWGSIRVYHESGSIGNVDINVQDTSIMTSGDGSRGIFAWHLGEGNIEIDIRGTTIETLGANAFGIYGRHDGTGNLDINILQGSAITTSESHGIYGRHLGTGALGIQLVDGSVTTEGDGAHGIYGYHPSTGDISIDVQGGTTTTSGDTAHGIYGRHLGTGDVSIDVQDSTISTSGADAHGIHAVYRDADSVDIQIRDAVIRATGLDAHGVQVGTLDEDGAVQGSVGVDEEGYRRQTVTVGSEVRGGSGDAAGIFLAGGGRVVVGPHGRVGAASGVAIRAAGPGQDGQPGSLSVDLTLNARPLQEVLGGGRIVNDDGTVELMANGVMLFDGAAGATDRWAPNGPWDVTARTVETGGIETMQAYASRAELYESLPGLLLLLDAGAPVQRSEEPVWAQAGYGAGSGEAKRSQTGASYDFDRIEAAAGISRSWSNGFGGSLWLRHIQSEVKANAVSGAGELDLHGAGAGVSAHWRGAGGLEVSGEVLLTDFDVDADSARHGRLARDVEAELWQARLETGYRLKREGGLTLLPRVWAWHAEADIDDFTDAVGSRVAYAEESRSAAGLGLLAEVHQLEYSLYGSLDVESMFAGEETAIEVSGHRLTSESKRTRVLAGMGGRWQGKQVMLQGGLRLADPSGRNQEVSASLSIGGSF